MNQAKKIADNAKSDLGKRLHQTLAQNEKLKSKIGTMNLGEKIAQMSSQKQTEEQTETNKLLSRRNSELCEVGTNFDNATTFQATNKKPHRALEFPITCKSPPISSCTPQFLEAAWREG
ncbi:hypothetical protein AVEN_12807-1 [Araneus ventricosus]|uniref:Uncharacterized protein n=1 Tax=Araneus ventricosus TaxID=182803 RepID=A0A4Y2AD70_ARAVE|nr:hypothetical protein AVEN_12807-1 [Araneus ventricosus]